MGEGVVVEIDQALVFDVLLLLLLVHNGTNSFYLFIYFLLLFNMFCYSMAVFLVYLRHILLDRYKFVVGFT